MGYSEADIEHIGWNYEQLRNIVRPESEEGLDEKQKLQSVEKIIHTEIPELLKKVAPPDIYNLREDFEAEYEKFKDFIIYKALIGKKIIGLGGGFSSGKSTFLNCLMGQGNILPENIDASTAVPTYIVRGKSNQVKAVNIFDASIRLELFAINQIAHGFGKVGEDPAQQTDAVKLGHLLKNMFFETELLKYDNLTFLDTPGYSKPDSEFYSAKTDEHIARQQLNTVDYILWFLPVEDGGALTESDIKFIKSLDGSIPITVICSKAQRRTEKQREAIRKKIEEQIALHKLPIKNVYFFDREIPGELDSAKIYELFDRLDQQPYEERVFAKHFKRMFWNCREYYRSKKEENDREIRNLNNALLHVDEDEVVKYITRVKENSETEQKLMAQAEKEMENLQTKFFTEIKIIADQVGITMPEPKDIDVLEDKITDPLSVLQEYNRAHNKSVPKNLKEELMDAFRDVTPVFECEPGGSKYKDVVTDILSEIDFPKTDEILFGTDVNYNEMMKKALRGATNKNDKLK